MIQSRSVIEIADNSGAKKIRCIQVCGGSGRKSAAKIGDTIVASIIELKPNTKKLSQGDICKAIIISTKKQTKRLDGTAIRFGKNLAVLVNNNNKPLGTRILCPISEELRGNNLTRVIAIAPTVL
jgi:large subunit ribosomal protein L14